MRAEDTGRHGRTGRSDLLARRWRGCSSRSLSFYPDSQAASPWAELVAGMVLSPPARLGSSVDGRSGHVSTSAWCRKAQGVAVPAAAARPSGSRPGPDSVCSAAGRGPSTPHGRTRARLRAHAPLGPFLPPSLRSR